MNTNNNNLTSYRVAHRFIPTIAFESNVSSLDTAKESIPNTPNLKQWNYDTITNINYGFKCDPMDPLQKSKKINFDQINYIMPQWEKYWSNPPKPMHVSQTEYNDKYIKPKLMSNVNQTPSSMICLQSKFSTRNKEIITMQPPKISDVGKVRKMDPYVTTQKLAYIEIDPITAKQINLMQPKKKQIMPEYEPFYNEPIFNRQKTIRLLPNTIKYVPHNALKTEMSASYKIPINTLSKLDSTVEMPISISQNPTLSQILSVPEMYTSEYSKIGGK